MTCWPRSPGPITPNVIRSFAPSTREYDAAEIAAIPCAAPRRKLRRGSVLDMCELYRRNALILEDAISREEAEMHKARLLVLFCLAAAMSRTAPASQVPAVRPAAHTGAKTAAARPAPTDAEIERSIRARFARSKISVNKFQVHVQGGVATIEGHTDVIQHKGTATRLARSGGALQVVNRIEVSQAARERASANLAKGRRRAQVKRSEPRSAAPGR